MHRIRYSQVTSVSTTDDRPFFAQCDCGQNSGWQATLQACQDWEIRHHQVVERALAALRRATPGLADQRAYFQSKADDPNIPTRQRAQWRMLARELDHRLNDRDPGAGQDSLF